MILRDKILRKGTRDEKDKNTKKQDKGKDR